MLTLPFVSYIKVINSKHNVVNQLFWKNVLNLSNVKYYLSIMPEQFSPCYIANLENSVDWRKRTLE